MTHNKSQGPSRRSLLTGAGTAALLASARVMLPGGAWAAGADTPETNTVTLGFIALTDSSPLIVAKEKGFFAKYGITDPKISKQASWGATRDNIELGSAHGGIDGAHILTPMPYLISTGKITNGGKLPMYILARLNTNGQAISVAKYYGDLGVGLDSSRMKSAFGKVRMGGGDPKVAMTFPGGTHDMWVRYWLAAGGIDPDKDVSTITVPPPQMVANMKVKTMEAFCVGEPWNAQLVNQGIGFTACVTGELWHDHPEKSLGLRADWVDKNPKAAKAVTMAVLEAQRWCDKPENRSEMCQIVSKREWFKVPFEDIIGRTSGMIDYGTGKTVQNFPYLMKFWKDHASYPFQSHDAWFLAENIRWGYQPANLDINGWVKKVNREDIWRDAAKAIGAAGDIPASTSRGVEKFFDGKTFDAADPKAYLASLKIKRI
ncbi:MAG: ABC transporter substrate-binding protein [Proteobacteria bacterium]|nr:ABC transporter substrate-binding protein [Pseudomonadota bacterium]